MNKGKLFYKEKIPKLSLKPKILISITILKKMRGRLDHCVKQERRNVHNLVSTAKLLDTLFTRV